MGNKIVSADCHMDLFYLPMDTFTSRAPANLKDRVPRVVNIDGKPTWVGDGAVMGGHAAWMGRGQMNSHRGIRIAESQAEARRSRFRWSRRRGHLRHSLRRRQH